MRDGINSMVLGVSFRSGRFVGRISRLTLKSGNLTMQRYNTGLGGYKTFNQTMLLNRMAPWSLDRDKAGRKLALTDADLLRAMPRRKISMLFLQAELSPASASR